MSQTKALYRLQTIDLDLEKQRKRLRAIKDQLEQDASLRQARDAVTVLEAAQHPVEARVTDLNLELQSLSTQSKQLNDRLYGGKVNNPKEIKDLEGKIEELKRRRSILENTLLENMLTLEDLQASLVDARQQLAQVEQSFSTEHAALRAEGRDLQESIKALKDNREAALQLVEPESLGLYERMRGPKLGRVIAPLDGDSCSVCGVGQTTTLAQRVRQGHELITCSNCGRILIAL